MDCLKAITPLARPIISSENASESNESVILLNPKSEPACINLVNDDNTLEAAVTCLTLIFDNDSTKFITGSITALVIFLNGSNIVLRNFANFLTLFIAPF